MKFCLFFVVTCACMVVQAKDFSTKEAIEYSKVGDRTLLLDVYVPESDGPHPAVLVVHGGAWRSGSRTQLRGYATALAERGFVCFAIEYRLAPKHKWPAQIDDCRSAVKWIRKHATKYKADPTRLGAIGYSAGGHLVSLLATTGQAPSEANGNVDTRLTAVVAGGAPTDFRWFPDNGRWAKYLFGGDLTEEREKFQSASATAFVDKADPPIFFFNGTADKLVPLAWTMSLHSELKKNGIETELLKIADAGHMKAAADVTALKRGYEFLNKHLKPQDGAASDEAIKATTAEQTP